MNTECEQYQGRLREICDGSANMSIRKINAYRQNWGLSPLPDDGRVVNSVTRGSGVAVVSPGGKTTSGCKSCGNKAKKKPITKSGAGSELVAYYKSLGMPNCQQCLDLAEKMDQWGVAECRSRIEDIVSDILPRAKKWVENKAPWLHWMLPTVIEDAGLKLKIRHDVTSAIDRAEKAAAAKKEKSACKSCSKPDPRKPSRAALIESAKLREVRDSTPVSIGVYQSRRATCDECPLLVNGSCSLSESKIDLSTRGASCPVGKWSTQTATRRPLINPTRNLIFHLYPLIGAEWNWHWHIDQIRHAAPLFNGRIAIATVTGEKLASHIEVRELFRDIPVTDWVVKPNSKLAETVTFTDLLQIVKTDDPNAITFRGHTKGVTHTRQGAEQPWARLMWSTLMDLPSVDDALSSHIMAGSMKCHEPLVSNQRYKWFYAGTFFWFRNREIFERDWSTMEQTRWYPEAWPGVLCKNEEAACLCHDFTKSSVLNNEYWLAEAASDFERWKSARPGRDKSFE